MGYGIERRLKRDLFSFLLLDGEFFEDLANCAARSPENKSIIESYLPDRWSLIKEGIWYHATPPVCEIPDQGFKIHVSATSATAEQVLHKVIPICVEYKAPFKAVVDWFILDFINSKNYPRSSSGKFLVIYPKDEPSFVRILESLYEVTGDLCGPFILSDKPYKDSRVLFYRYGAFINKYKLNIFGEKVPLIMSHDGKLVPDVRTPYFYLPENVKDPFETLDLNYQGELKLKGRYVIKSHIRSSNSGGVYNAEDVETGQKVIVKEARPFVNASRSSSFDAIDMLRKEARVLEKLQHTGYTPKIIDCFQDWEHLFLVMETVQGFPLSSYRALNNVGLLLRRNITAETIKEFCSRLNRIGSNALKAIQAFHKEGVVIGDVSPSNVLVDLETLEVKIIDFEGARIMGETDLDANIVATTGYVSPERLSGSALTFKDDFYALGCLIYSIILPIQEFFHLNPDARDLFIDGLIEDFNLPGYIKEAICALMSGNIGKAERLLLHSAPQIESVEIIQQNGERKFSLSDISEVVRGVTDYILHTPDLQRSDRLWPADYRVFTTNPLNISYGAMGIALYLKEVLGAVPDEIKAWMVDKMSYGSYPPGLYVGLAGVALGFSEIGLEGQAIEVWNSIYESPLISEGLDIFYGVAGIGLASLYFWHKTSNQMFLDTAQEAGEALLYRAGSDESGYFWENVDGEVYYGYAHGGSGISMFLLYLYHATKENRYLDYAVGGLDYEIAKGEKQEDYTVWFRSRTDNLISPYWRYGSAGIGSVLIRFYAMLSEDRYRIIAEEAAKYVATKYAVFPGQFVGLSGMGEFLIDLYFFTGEEKHLESARRLAEGVLLYTIKKPKGVAFPGEELLRISTDFGTGSAGIGLFLSRLINPRGRLLYEQAAPPTLRGGLN
jgi:serine/threonine protein kinase